MSVNILSEYTILYPMEIDYQTIRLPCVLRGWFSPVDTVFTNGFEIRIQLTYVHGSQIINKSKHRKNTSV